MITHIEIDGFKTFHNFSTDLLPFQVFIGPNGVGKSNLFDVIVLLSNLASDNTIYEAFRKSRGDVSELFTRYPDGTRASRMFFCVEMLIEPHIVDDLGSKEEVSSTRLRYQLIIERRPENGFERLYVVQEELKVITGDDDQWVRKNIPTGHRKDWIIRGRRTPYISTVEESGQKIIYRHQDGRQGGKQGTVIGRLERTILSLTNSAEYPTIYAVRREMISWKFLQLDPVRLRTPSSIYSPADLLPDGSNLASVLYRIARDDEFALADISRDMMNLVSGVLEVQVKPVAEREEFIIEVVMTDQTRFSSRVLSDGTLRLLTLVALKNDSTYRGVVCLEEPENGVHPFRLEKIIEFLYSLSTDFKAVAENNAPRQVLMNTHSPYVLPYVPAESLLYLDVAQLNGVRQTYVVPVKPTLIADDARNYFTWHQVQQYLNHDPIANKLEEITALRSSS